MILELPEVFKGIGYYQGISLILWIIAISLMFVSSGLFAFRVLKIEEKSPKMGYTAYTVFFLCIGLARIFYIIAVYSPENYDFFVLIGYLLEISAIIFWLYVIETHIVTFTKKIFLIICLIIVTVYIIALLGVTTRDFALTLGWILIPFAVTAIGVLYVYIIVKSSGSIRIKALFLLLGLILIYIGVMMDSELFISSFPFVPLEIAPSLWIAGTLIFTWSQLFYKPED